MNVYKQEHFVVYDLCLLFPSNVPAVLLICRYLQQFNNSFYSVFTFCLAHLVILYNSFSHHNKELNINFKYRPCGLRLQKIENFIYSIIYTVPLTSTIVFFNAADSFEIFSALLYIFAFSLTQECQSR